MIASQVTSGNLSSPLLVANGETIRVFGLIVNATGSTLKHLIATDPDDNVLFRIPIEVRNIGGVSLTFEWIADKGLKLTTSDAGSEVDVVVFHSQKGS